MSYIQLLLPYLFQVGVGLECLPQYSQRARPGKRSGDLVVLVEIVFGETRLATLVLIRGKGWSEALRPGDMAQYL